MKPTHFQIEFTNERIIPSGGLTLVGYILENSGFIDRLNRQDVTGRRSGHQIKNGDILGSYIGCLCMGKPDFETIRETNDDPEFISIKYCKRAMIDSENCPVTALFCAVYVREMTCYIPAAERTYTYPKTTFTRRYEHERITLQTCRGTAETDGTGHFGNHPGEGCLQEGSHLCLPNWLLHHQQGRCSELDGGHRCRNGQGRGCRIADDGLHRKDAASHCRADRFHRKGCTG